MKKLIALFLLLAFPVLAGPPILLNYYVTNTTPTVHGMVTNIAIYQISIDVTKQPASAALTNYAAMMKFTGIVTNVNDNFGVTNYMCFTNGILATNKFTP